MGLRLYLVKDICYIIQISTYTLRATYKFILVYHCLFKIYISTRYNEIVNKQPFVVSHDLLKKVKLKTDDDKVIYNLYN